MSLYQFKRLPVLPTRRGVAALVLGIALYALAWLTHIAWIFVADSLIWAVILVNIALPWLNARKLYASRDLSVPQHNGCPGVFEEEEVCITIHIESRSVIPKFLLALKECCPLAYPLERDRGFLIASMAPHGKLRIVYRARSYLRGIYHFPRICLTTSAPFGLFESKKTLEAPLKAIIYPLALPMKMDPYSWGVMGELSRPLLPKDSGELRGSRGYQMGDRINTIHWRNSARRGQLMVKEFDEVAHGEIALAFNPSFVKGEEKENTLEYSIKIAASIAGLCFKEQRPFRLWPHPSNRPAMAKKALMEYLASLTGGSSQAVAQMLRSTTVSSTAVVVVSAADRSTLSLLYQQDSRIKGAVVILLNGFAAGESKNADERLNGMGAWVVHCQRGRLKEALEDAGDLLDKRVSVASTPSVNQV